MRPVVDRNVVMRRMTVLSEVIYHRECLSSYLHNLPNLPTLNTAGTQGWRLRVKHETEPNTVCGPG